MSGQREVEPARSGEIDCSYCGSGVPDGSFCGACGAHLAHGRYRGAATRAHAHAAFQDEGVLRLGVVSSLFPRLPGAARGAYRVAPTGWRPGCSQGCWPQVAAAGLQAPVIAVSALAIPLLFLIYVYETGPRDRRFAVATAAVFAAEAALGVAWALEFGPVVSGALVPAPGSSLTSGDALVSAVAVPVFGQLLMLLPAAAARLATPGRSEALEGFTAGVVSALGVTMAATLTELAPLLRYGNLIQDSSVLANLTQAVILGAILGTFASFLLLNSMRPNEGWRVAFLMGPALAFVILIVRRNLPESPRWLITHGREAEAEEAMRRIEQAAISDGQHLEPVPESAAITILPETRYGYLTLLRVAFRQYPQRAILGATLMITQSFLYNAIFFTYALVLTKFYHVSNDAVPLYGLAFAVGSRSRPRSPWSTADNAEAG